MFLKNELKKTKFKIDNARNDLLMSLRGVISTAEQHIIKIRKDKAFQRLTDIDTVYT